MAKQEAKIIQALKVKYRTIYKVKGNKNLILTMLKKEDLTINQIARRIKMTRQGVRFHMHNLERESD